MYPIHIKRIYASPEAGDGWRVLVDRLWPRGVSKGTAALNEWNKEIAPSTALRQRYGGMTESFDEFAALYRRELADKIEALAHLRTMAMAMPVTLLYAGRHETANHALVLRDVLLGAK